MSHRPSYAANPPIKRSRTTQKAPPPPHPNFPIVPQVPLQLSKYELQPPDKKNLNPRLGPPDFFPVSDHDVEDKIDSKTIKEGFSDPMLMQNESSSCKYEFSAKTNFAELKGKLLQTVKEIEWYKANAPRQRKLERSGKKGKQYPTQIACSKEISDKWMKSLAGVEPIHKLSQKVPHGYKGDALIRSLMKEQVPFLRATWYIKVIYLNVKANPQKIQDPQTDWTNTIVQFLSSFIPETCRGTQKSIDGFNYVIGLINWNYQEGLFNYELFLNKLIDLLHELPKPEELCLVVSMLLDYLVDICRLSNASIRRLVMWCNEKLVQVRPHDVSPDAPRTPELKLYNSIRSIMQYLLLDSPEALSTLETKSLSTYLNTATSTPSFFPPFFEGLCTDYQEEVLQLHSLHDQFLSMGYPQKYSCDPTEELDDFFKSLDIEHVYKQIFSVNNEKLENYSNIEEKVSLICEWGVTCNRSIFAHRPAISLSLLRLYINHSGGDATTRNETSMVTAPPPLQRMLLKFLDTYKPRDEEYTSVACLFGELIRGGLFSHDLYVRDLISRGVLEQVHHDEVARRHHWYISQLPIFNGPNLRHEQNQRNAALKYSQLPAIGALNLDKMKQIFTRRLEELGTNPLRSVEERARCLAILSEASLHYQMAITEWLEWLVKSHYSAVAAKQNGSGLHITHPEQLLFVIQSMEAVKDSYSLTSTLLWIVSQSMQLMTASVVISSLRKHEHSFLCYNSMPQLVNALYSTHKEDAESGAMICKYLLELFEKYGNLNSMKQWMVEHKTAVDETKAVSLRSTTKKPLQDILDFSLRDLPVDAISFLREPLESARSQHLDIEGLVPLLVDHGISHCAQTRKYSDLNVLTILLSRLASEYPTVHNSFFALTEKSILPKHCSSEEEQRAVLHLLLGLAWRQFILLPPVISNIIAPCLAKCYEELKDGKPFSISPILYLRLLNILLGNLTFLQDESQSIPEYDKTGLFSMIHPLLSFYYQFRKSAGSQDPISLLVQSILSNGSFSQICLINVKDLYKQLSGIGDQSTKREIFNMINDKNDAQLTSENLASLGPEIIVEVLSNTDKWTLQNSWLDLRLLLDQWQTVTGSLHDGPAQLVRVVLYQLVHSLDAASLYCKLISQLGEPIQNQYVEEVQKILENNELLLGSTSLGEVLLSYKPPSTPLVSKLPGITELNQSFVDMVIPCVLASSAEKKQQFALSLLSQMDKLHNAFGQNASSWQETPQDAVHYGLMLRLHLLIVMIPTIKEHHKLCKFDEFATLLLSYLSKPAVQSSPIGEEMFSFMLNVLEVLLSNHSDTQQQNGRKSQHLVQLNEKLRLQFQDTDFVETYRTRIEQTLPFLRSSAPRFGAMAPVFADLQKNKRSFDVWSLLEDYPDAPLSPTTDFDAVKVERSQLTYATTPTKVTKKRKV